MRGLPESLGELPVVCLAEEIDTPGDGQIRGLVTVAGNPVLSTPNAARLDAALAGLEAYVAVDPYVNETTRHADVILPVPSPLQRGHYDLFLSQLALRNVARYTPPVLPLDPGMPDEWEVLARLALVAAGVEPGRRRPRGGRRRARPVDGRGGGGRPVEPGAGPRRRRARSPRSATAEARSGSST